MKNLPRYMADFLDARLGKDLLTSVYQFRTHFELSDKEATHYIKIWMDSKSINSTKSKKVELVDYGYSPDGEVVAPGRIRMGKDA